MAGPPPTKPQILLDKKIQVLEVALSEWRSQKNRRLPISKLPSELLGRIFAIAAPVYEFDVYGGTKLVELGYGFSFASKHLRHVALSTPGIWGLILPKYPNWARLCLERSQNSSLKIKGYLGTGDINSSWNVLVLDAIRNHMHRIQDLQITGCPKGTAQLLLDAFPGKAPHLRRLQISCDWDEERNELKSGCLTSTQLSDLDLSGCDIDWKSSLLTGMTSLTISNIRTKPAAEDFFSALARMPRLEKLDLVDALPVASESPPSTMPRTNLSYLNLLRISSTLADAMQVMWSLLIPTQSNVKFDLYGPNRTSLLPKEVTGVVSFLTDFFTKVQQSDGHPLQYDSLLAQYCFEPQIALFLFWKKSWPDQRRLKIHREDSSEFELKLRWDHSPHPFVSQIICTFPVDHLKTLSLFSPVDKETLMSTFGNLPDLRAIMVDHESIPTVAKVLTCKLSGSPSQSSLFAFQQLRLIGMENMTFSKRRFLTVEKFRACLAERREQGLPLDVLLIRKSSNIFARDIEMLRKLVVELCWDGQEYRSDEITPYNVEDYPEVYVASKKDLQRIVYGDPEDYYGW